MDDEVICYLGLRQAGRYLPEFKEILKDVDFFTACENPFIASELTL